jgi:hypothetical protein
VVLVFRGRRRLRGVPELLSLLKLILAATIDDLFVNVIRRATSLDSMENWKRNQNLVLSHD